jgi:hypothetical protein
LHCLGFIDIGLVLGLTDLPLGFRLDSVVFFFIGIIGFDDGIEIRVAAAAAAPAPAII